MREHWTTEGPQRISATFTHDEPLVTLNISTPELRRGEIGLGFKVTMDVEEFRSFLKAALRFDEQIGVRKLAPGTPDPRD